MAVPSIPNTFVANTKAKAAEVNANFANVLLALSSGTSDLLIGSMKNSRLISTSITVTGYQCLYYGFPVIDSLTTVDIATSTARFVALSEVIVYGTLDVATGAVAAVV